MRLFDNFNRMRIYLLIPLFVVVTACRDDRASAIHFDKVPPSNTGGRERMETISGTVRGARNGQRIVVFAKAGAWWVQPYSDRPFTTIGKDGEWSTSIHLGTEYGALLVDQGYEPLPQIDALPEAGRGIEAVASVVGGPDPKAVPTPAPIFAEFSGYRWRVFDWMNDRLGFEHGYSAKNVSVDAKGQLHLRITGSPGHWACSQLNLSNSLGYGSYLFTVQNTSQLEPAAVLSMYTWTDLSVEQNHKEMDINLTRWGKSTNKNGEFVLQPYYLPQNTSRFNTPPVRLTYSFRWEPGGVTFTASSGAAGGPKKAVIADHTFNVGVPSTGGEATYLNFCEFKYSSVPLQHEAEAVIERFQYLP